MIPLEKKESVKSDYQKWYRGNEKKLEDHFSDYLKAKKSGWIPDNHKKYIMECLAETSRHKCAYCERIPNKGGSYLEIEHFYPKSRKEYRHMVFAFENLLPSCPQCNRVKGQRFRNEDGVEILDPYQEKCITTHLILNTENMWISGKSARGKVTVEFLDKSLNTSKFLHEGELHSGALHVREEILRGINEKLAILKENRYEPGSLYFELKALLVKVDERKSVTAARATVLLNHPGFLELLEKLGESDKDRYDELCSLAESKRRFCLSLP